MRIRQPTNKEIELSGSTEQPYRSHSPRTRNLVRIIRRDISQPRKNRCVTQLAEGRNGRRPHVDIASG